MLSALLLAFAALVPPQSGEPQVKPGGAPQADSKQAERVRELDLQYQALTEQYTRSEVEWTDQMRAFAANPEGRKELAEKHPVKAYWERFERLASDGQGRALVWLASHADKRFSEREDVLRQKRALYQKLIDEHASDAWAMEIVTELALQRYWFEVKGTEDLLNDFARKTKNREFAAQALTRLIAVLTGVAGQDENAAKADAIRERLIHEFADTSVGKKLTEQTAAKAAGVVPGSPAPEFSGKDVDGAEVGLGAASRGKVVLLDFWGFWSPQSRSMIPHLRELLARHAADPFLILGVNSDEDAARFRELSKEHNVGWRSAYEAGRSGPIAKRYQVNAYPTLFLINAKGVILKSWVTPPADALLDEEVARAIAAAKSPAK